MEICIYSKDKIKDKMVEISDNIREAENEKYEYVSGKFIRCVNSFNEFSKENIPMTTYMSVEVTIS